MDVFIELQNASYAYPGPGGASIPALLDVSLRIAEGEYIVLAGANGSGKSTLARLLNALLIPDNGSVNIAGMDTRHPNHHLEIRRSVGMVFQRPEDQMIASTIEDDVAFGPENLAVPPDEIQLRVRQALDAVDLWAIRHRRPDMVSAGQMQRIALAGVLAMQPRCILFDEATAMLDPEGRKTVRAYMKKLHNAGLTIINITHFMEEALDATRMVVLHEGRVVMDNTPTEIFKSEDALSAVGLDLPPAGRLASTLRKQGVPIGAGILTVQDLVDALDHLDRRGLKITTDTTGSDTTKPVISVRDLSYTYMVNTPLAHQALDKVNITVRTHQTHGLMGPTGAGKSTLLQHLNGLLRPQQGTVEVYGHDLRDPETELAAVRRMVGLVFQLPESQIFEQYVGDEIAYGPRLAGLGGEALRERVRWAMAMVGLDFDSTKDRPTFALSGGEKRKVALASSLALRPDALLLDEPTAGLDPVSRRELLDRLLVLAGEMTLVVSSHQMEDLAFLGKELSVIADGGVLLSGKPGEVFAQKDVLLEHGLDIPITAQVIAGLRERGWVVPTHIVKTEQLAAILETRDG